MMTAVRFTCPVTSTMKKTPTTAARARSEEIIRSRRECRSARTPPQRRVASIATDSAASTNPSEPADFVSAVTRQPTAITNAASPMNEIVWPPQSSRKSRLEKAASVLARPRSLTAASTAAGYPRPMAQALRAVVFDVDFTLAKPGPDLGPDGYRALGQRYGLDLDPSRYDEARRAAVRALERHPELDHDEEIWVLFTERIMQGMGGSGDTRGAATEMTAAWSHAEHFELYDDALPTLELLRGQGLKVGLLSNTARNLPAFAAHHGLHADALLTSHAHGKEKPHASIFERILALLGVEAGEAAMVGDTLEDDIHGAQAIGMSAVLVDRDGRYPEVPDRLESLVALPDALGLNP